MSGTYLIVGLFLGSAVGYIVSTKIPKKDQGFEILVGGMVMLFWLPLLCLLLLGGVIGLGALLGKILLRGSEAVLPKLEAAWNAFNSEP